MQMIGNSPKHTSLYFFTNKQEHMPIPKSKHGISSSYFKITVKKPSNIQENRKPILEKSSEYSSEAVNLSRDIDFSIINTQTLLLQQQQQYYKRLKEKNLKIKTLVRLKQSSETEKDPTTKSVKKERYPIQILCC